MAVLAHQTKGIGPLREFMRLHHKVTNRREETSLAEDGSSDFKWLWLVLISRTERTSGIDMKLLLEIFKSRCNTYFLCSLEKALELLSYLLHWHLGGAVMKWLSIRCSFVTALTASAPSPSNWYIAFTQILPLHLQWSSIWSLLNFAASLITSSNLPLVADGNSEIWRNDLTSCYRTSKKMLHHLVAEYEGIANPVCISTEFTDARSCIIATTRLEAWRFQAQLILL